MTGGMKIKSLLPTATERRDSDRYNNLSPHNQQQQRQVDGAYSKGLVASALATDETVGDSYDDSRAELVAMNHNLVSNHRPFFGYMQTRCTIGSSICVCSYPHTTLLPACLLRRRQFL